MEPLPGKYENTEAKNRLYEVGAIFESPLEIPSNCYVILSVDRRTAKTGFFWGTAKTFVRFFRKRIQFVTSKT